MRLRLRSRQAGRRINVVLGLLLAAAVLTGVAGMTVGVNWPLDLIQLHAAAALAVVLLSPYKIVVIRRGLARPARPRRVKALSLTLAAFLVLTIGSGLVHSTGHFEYVGPLTLMQIHVGAAIGASALVVAHFLMHAVRPRRADADRRALLRLAALGVGASAATAVWDTQAATARRFTGSVPRPSLRITAWFDDGVQRIDPATWQLRVGTTSFSAADVRDLPRTRLTATLDCTSGWCSTQEWDGLRLGDLLDAAGVRRGDWRSVAVRSTTGYTRWFGASTLDDVWLATALNGRPLPYGHGYPARIVAPGRRGFWWVKWVTAVEPSTRPPWAQSPFPLG